MSKSKHNYSQYSKKTAPIVPPSSTLEVKMEPELVKETVDTVSLPKNVHGVVVNCSKLNIREEPTVESNVVCVLDVKSEIEIDVTKSDNEWFKVYTVTGIEGYCMRKFVDARL